LALPSFTLVAACLLGFAYLAWAVYGVGWVPAAWGVALMAIGLPVYVTTRLSRLNHPPADNIPPAVEASRERP
jgi:hypothetical protein